MTTKINNANFIYEQNNLNLNENKEKRRFLMAFELNTDKVLKKQD